MTRSYPDTIPTPYATNEALSDAYRRGWNHGHGLACHNVPSLGDNLFIEDMGRIQVDAENIRDVHQSLCFSAESSSRDYSPFEFTAHEFNEAGEGDDATPGSDALWETFEAGTNDAIFADLATYTDEDYGLEGEGEETDEENC